MIPISQEAEDALGLPRFTDSRVTLLPDMTVNVVGGSVTLDKNGSTTRSASLTLTTLGWDQQTVEGLYETLWASGGWLTVETAIIPPGQGPVWVPLGKFQVQSAPYVRPGGTITVEALGVLKAVEDARFLNPYQVDPSVQGLAALTALIQEAVPGTPVTLGPGVVDAPVGAGVYDESRLDACQDIATALGGWLWETATGGVEVRVDGTASVFDLGPLHTEFRIDTKRDGMWNAVRARSSNEATSDVVAYAYDLNPDSATYWDGPFGHKPYFYASPLLTDTDQAQQAADTLLAGLLGADRERSAKSPPVPHIEPGDVVQLPHLPIDSVVQQHQVGLGADAESVWVLLPAPGEGA